MARRLEVFTNSTLEYIGKKYGLDLSQRKMPIEMIRTNRKMMAQTLYELGLNVGAEIGVAQANHAVILCENHPDIKLYAVDIWEPFPGYYEYRDRIHKYYEMAKERLMPFGDHVVFVKKLSMDAVNDFPDNTLDFVYLDAGHDFKSIADDLCMWYRKVHVGGIVYGHDYKRRIHREDSVIQVKDVVQAFMYSHRISPWFVLGENSNHNDGMFKEGAQSWMFVRQDEDLVIKA